jgi:hypothetical protein
LNLLDDTPVVPGDTRGPYEYGPQARQILNDAEDDLKDWEPELEDVSSQAQVQTNLMPNSTPQRGAQSSIQDEEFNAGEGTRINSGTSVATGQAENYALSETGTSQVA